MYNVAKINKKKERERKIAKQFRMFLNQEPKNF